MLRAEEIDARAGDFGLRASLTVDTGRCLALVGPSGAGKTTLLRTVAGLLRPASGRIACGSQTWLDRERGLELSPELRRCAYVFQDYALFGHLSAWRNVAYPLRRLGRAERQRRAMGLLERFGLLSRADARPGSLSGGERQRVALARALAMEPSVLLLDEPLAALDAQTRVHASRELGAVLADSPAPALLVTHDFTEAATLGDELAVIDRGEIVQRGSATELAARPRSPFVADLVGSVVLTGTASAGQGLTVVELDDGGRVFSAGMGASGAVSAVVHPWDITLELPGPPRESSARNRLEARVCSVTELGPRVRVELEAGQRLAAEVTPSAVSELGLAPGAGVVAVFKASAVRLLERSRSTRFRA